MIFLKTNLFFIQIIESLLTKKKGGIPNEKYQKQKLINARYLK